MLYLVATPIGNLSDISNRAIEVLKEVDIIYAEDKRVTLNLLNHFEIKSALRNYHQQSSFDKKLEILAELNNGKKIALVTDAGTPGISDPGNELVDYLLDQNKDLKVVAIPGASSLTVAISISGFDCSRFSFVGFLPKKKRQKLYTEIFARDEAVVFFESPFRIEKTIDELIKLNLNRRVCVCMELTKLHEKTYRGNLEGVKNALLAEKQTLGRIKGEIVVVVEKSITKYSEI